MTIRECLGQVGYDLSQQTREAIVSNARFSLDRDLPEDGIEITEEAIRFDGKPMLAIEITNAFDTFGDFICLYLDIGQAKKAVEGRGVYRFRPVYPSDFLRGGVTFCERQVFEAGAECQRIAPTARGRLVE